MRLITAATCVFAASIAVPATAQDEGAVTMACPIGGAEFEYRPAQPAAAASTRPDGKPIGPAASPPPLPECPDNGLVLYKEYEAEEVAKLEPLVASEAYRGLYEHPQYYRAYWLMREMGLPPREYLYVLLQAAWQADGRPELRTRYLIEFADETAKSEPEPDDLNWIAMEGRAINALREVGRFDEAAARLEKLPLDALAVEAPPAEDMSAAARQARVRRGWFSYFEGLKAALARGDASPEPFDMLPRRIAIGRCIADEAQLDEAQKAFCEAESAAIEALRAARLSEEEELKALGRTREESGR
jgi:hypothetical protein